MPHYPSRGMQPFFTVIVACFNAEAYLEEAIHSALGQTFGDLEVIAVDDGSTDASWARLKTLVAQDPRLRIYRNDGRRGPGAARNVAAFRGRGRWLAVLDADDVWVSSKLEQQHAAIARAGNGLVLLGTNSVHIDASGRPLARFAYPSTDSRLKRHLITGRRFPPHSSIAYRASTFHALGGFNSRFLRAQDYDLWLRMSTAGQFGVVETVLTRYRFHSAGITHQPSSEGYGSRVYAVAAGAAHFLREEAHFDPSTEFDDVTWASFLSHVARELEERQDGAFQHFRSRLRAVVRDPRLGMGELFVMMARNPGYSAQILFERIGGDRLPRQCSENWLRRRED